MKSLGVLKQISTQQGISGPVSEAMEAVARILDDGLDTVEQHLFVTVGDAPNPVDEISAYILDAGGKRIRPSLCMLASRINGGQETPVELAVVCELLHNATLLHDDVIDEGDVRRGKPAARMVWSNALSILGGDYMLMKCVETIAALDGPYMDPFVTTLKALVNGEIVQLGLREKVETSANEYFHIVNGKTSSLFGFATATGARWGGASDDDCTSMGEFGSNIGVAFQLIDDVLDFSSKPGDLGKDLLADIGQGKMTLPVIVAAAKEPEVHAVLAQLVAGENPEQCATRISEFVSKTGALDTVRKKAREYTEASVAALDRIENAQGDVVCVLRDLSFALLHRGK
jgi:octaprenyl-diphosphate synthase